MIIRRHGDWLFAKVGGELVMMSAETGNYIGLTDVGTRVWDLIETPRSIDEVCAQLVREFEVSPDVCRTEVEAFIQELVKHGAAVIDLPEVA